jgi:hypothetical protein
VVVLRGGVRRGGGGGGREHTEIEFVPRVVEEQLVKRKDLHERPPPLSAEPPSRQTFENEDMEDDQ